MSTNIDDLTSYTAFTLPFEDHDACIKTAKTITDDDSIVMCVQVREDDYEPKYHD